MKEQILNQLQSMYAALNNTSVQGEQNCVNLAGVMQMLRELIKTLNEVTIEDDRKEG